MKVHSKKTNILNWKGGLTERNLLPCVSAPKMTPYKWFILDSPITYHLTSYWANHSPLTYHLTSYWANHSPLTYHVTSYWANHSPITYHLTSYWANHSPITYHLTSYWANHSPITYHLTSYWANHSPLTYHVTSYWANHSPLTYHVTSQPIDLLCNQYTAAAIQSIKTSPNSNISIPVLNKLSLVPLVSKYLWLQGSKEDL